MFVLLRTHHLFVSFILIGYVNPAYAGMNGHTELYVATRKQWLNFKDAPTYTAINFLYPTNGRVSLGFSFMNRKLLPENSVALGTFAYRLPIAENKS